MNLLREHEHPAGHDFDAYRAQWQEYRILGREHIREDLTLDWQIRAFVLYASEFWLRFKNNEWRERTFPDGLPFERLTWLHFLSLVGWESLYPRPNTLKGQVDVEVDGRLYHVWHTNAQQAGSDERPLPIPDARGYPGLYFPMLIAWRWWKVAPLRLPTSIRYLDTFAHQGGAADQLVLEYRLAGRTSSKLIYEAVLPPDGYGLETLVLSHHALPPGADADELNVTLVFGHPYADLGGREPRRPTRPS